MMMPPEEYGFDFDPDEENFDDFMDDEEALVILHFHSYFTLRGLVRVFTGWVPNFS